MPFRNLIQNRVFRIERHARLIHIIEFHCRCGIDRSGIRFQFACHQLEKRCFAASVRSDDPDFLSCREIEGEMRDDLLFSARERDIFEFHNAVSQMRCLRNDQFHGTFAHGRIDRSNLIIAFDSAEIAAQTRLR